MTITLSDDQESELRARFNSDEQAIKYYVVQALIGKLESDAQHD